MIFRAVAQVTGMLSEVDPGDSMDPTHAATAIVAPPAWELAVATSVAVGFNRGGGGFNRGGGGRVVASVVVVDSVAVVDVRRRRWWRRRGGGGRRR